MSTTNNKNYLSANNTLPSRINKLLSGIDIPLKIESAQECVPLIWIAIAEGLLNERIEGIRRPIQGQPSSEQDRIHNIQTLLNWLSSILEISLGHIHVLSVVQMEPRALTFLTELFESLSDTLNPGPAENSANSASFHFDNKNNNNDSVNDKEEMGQIQDKSYYKHDDKTGIMIDQDEEEGSHNLFFDDGVSSIHSKSIMHQDDSISLASFDEDVEQKQTNKMSSSSIIEKSSVTSRQTRERIQRIPPRNDPHFTLSIAKDDVQEFIDKQDMLNYTTPSEHYQYSFSGLQSGISSFSKSSTASLLMGRSKSKVESSSLYDHRYYSKRNQVSFNESNSQSEIMKSTTRKSAINKRKNIINEEEYMSTRLQFDEDDNNHNIEMENKDRKLIANNKDNERLISMMKSLENQNKKLKREIETTENKLKRKQPLHSNTIKKSMKETNTIIKQVKRVTKSQGQVDSKKQKTTLTSLSKRQQAQKQQGLTSKPINKKITQQQTSNPVEKEFNQIQTFMERGIPLSQVPERVTSNAWAKQIEGWKRALNDRIWRENLHKIKHLNELQSSVEHQLAEGLVLLRQKELGGRPSSTKNQVIVAKQMIRERERRVTRMVKRQNVIEEDIDKMMKKRQHCEEKMAADIYKEYLKKQRLEIIVKRREAKEIDKELQRIEQQKVESQLNYLRDQNKMLKEALEEKRREEGIAMKAVEREGEKLIREFKIKMKDQIEKVKEKVELDHTFEQENAQDLKERIQMNLRRL